MGHEERDCGCGHGFSRRGILKAGLAAAATAAIGLGGDSLAENEVEARAQTRHALSSAGVRPIDIHAHYYPQVVLRCLHRRRQSASARNFRGPTRASPTRASPVGNQPVLPLKFIDLKLRLADMDQQGIAVQAVSLTSPMVYWGDEDFSHKLSRALERWRERGPPTISRAHRVAHDPADALPGSRH